ncbi:MAG: HAD-IC family P-type ATPase [Eubacterium sp.]|nr:HAD-IC family P-type ATPase [Eubacterium sp.]
MGLTAEQVNEAVRMGKVNRQPDSLEKTNLDIVKENVFTYFNLIFAVLAVLLIAAGSYRNLTFLGVIFANMGIGIFQQIRTKKILEELSVLNQPEAVVIREGKRWRIPVDKLVLGDMVILKSGDQICADAVVAAGEINVNESLLNGESDEIPKKRNSPLLSGSFVISGECCARLTKVGEDSYISKLTQEAKKIKKHEQSEMVRSINLLVIIAGILIIPVGLALFIQGMMFGKGFSQAVTSMVAAVIGMIPEGLYLLVSVTLAISTGKLALKKVMLHDMRSIESLARVDMFCVDKTGTITDNTMHVMEVLSAHGDGQGQSDTFYDEQKLSEYIYTLTDENQTMTALRDRYPQVIPPECREKMEFSSRYKYSCVRYEDGTYVLGAPDVLLAADYEKYRETVEDFAGKGLRVIVFGRVSGRQTTAMEEVAPPMPKKGLAGYVVTPLLFIALENSIRETARETFEYFDRQGVQIKVISGDNPLTVSEVAKRASIKNADQYIDARTIDSEEALREALETKTVFGRVTPEQKRQIVNALKDAGHTVAMTGDGVNDILAMKDADCSIAMASGSDAAVNAAQVALLDSDFSHMPEIVDEGRKNINNIERSATLFLVKNLFSLFLGIFAIINVMKYPLEPSQVSLISMFNIGVPAFLLALEPNYERITGRFLSKVLVRALPAAITDFLAIASLVYFAGTFNISPYDSSVAATFLLAIVGFIILFNISSPINLFRGAVIGLCMVGILVVGFFLSELFTIHMISRQCMMLFVLFAIATEPFMRYLTMFSAFVERKLMKIK